MELFLLTLSKKRYSFIGLAFLLPILLLAVTGFRIAATDEQIKNMLSIIEIFYPYFASLFVCAAIPRKDEAELIVLSGSSLTVSVLYEFAVFYVISLVSGEVAGAFLLPSWTVLQFALSFPVTLIFLFAAAFAIRFAVNNIYGNLGVHTVLFATLFFTGGMSPETAVTRVLAKRDLFVNGYAHMMFSDNLGNWYLMFGDVMKNRIIFLAVAVALLITSILLSLRFYSIKR